MYASSGPQNNNDAACSPIRCDRHKDAGREESATGRRGRSHKTRRVAGLGVLMAAALGMGATIGSGTASATSINQYPTFGCYKTAAGGIITGDELKVNLDGKTTTYFAEVYRWNNGWVPWGSLFNSSGGVYVTFQDTAFGELSEDVLSGSVTHGYYQVVFYMHSTGDSAAQKINALDLDNPTTRYNNYTCAV